MFSRRIWRVLIVLLLALSAGDLSAQSLTGQDDNVKKDPFESYRKAKKAKKLRKLTIPERIAILDSARTEALGDTLFPYASDSAQRNKMIVDVVVKTPAKEVRTLLDSMHTTVAMFEQDYSFLSPRQLKKVVRQLSAAVCEPDTNSKIFTAIPCESFREQLHFNIRNRGDSLFQSHSTSFCGKVVMTRLWIQKDTAEYKRFMTELYYHGRAAWNGTEFVTPPEVIKAVNENKIAWDPAQQVRFENEEMPTGMDMVLYLTLTSKFHSFPLWWTPYDPAVHDENGLWAATLINPQLNLIQSMGFEAEKVGNNLRGVSNRQFEKIKTAAADTNRTVFLLVNSSILDTLSGADTEYVVPRKIEHPMLGTHWITVEGFDTANDRFYFWEYGRRREVEGIEQLKNIIAGGIIVNDYQPE